MFVSTDGRYAVIQQGMNVEARLARRYHWLGPATGDPTLEPHAGIVSGRLEDAVLDLTSRRSEEARRALLDLAREPPRKVLAALGEAYRILRGLQPITQWTGGGEGAAKLDGKALRFYLRHYRPQPRPPRHLEPKLRLLYEASPRTVRELVELEGVGPAVIRSLALVAELVYGAEASHDDPATLDPFRYAYVVGGKDGVPFRFRPDLAERVVEFLEEAVRRARLGDREKLEALRRLRSLLAAPNHSSRPSSR